MNSNVEIIVLWACRVEVTCQPCRLYCFPQCRSVTPLTLRVIDRSCRANQWHGFPVSEQFRDGESLKKCGNKTVWKC